MLFYHINYSNRLLYYVSPCTDIMLMSLLFVVTYTKEKFVRYALIGTCSLFLIVMSYDYIKGDINQQINPYLTSGETLFVIILLLLMFRIIVVEQNKRLYRKAMLWLLTALLIGNLFSILFSSFSNVIQSYSNELYLFLIYVTSPFAILTNTLSMYGFYLVNRPLRVN